MNKIRKIVAFLKSHAPSPDVEILTEEELKKKNYLIFWLIFIGIPTFFILSLI